MFVKSGFFNSFLRSALVPCWKPTKLIISVSQSSQLLSLTSLQQYCISSPSTTLVKWRGMLSLNKHIFYYCSTTKLDKKQSNQSQKIEESDFYVFGNSDYYIDKTDSLQITFRYPASNILWMKRSGKTSHLKMNKAFFEIDHKNGQRLYQSSKGLEENKKLLKRISQQIEQLEQKEKNTQNQNDQEKLDKKSKKERIQQLKKNILSLKQNIKALDVQILKLKNKDPQLTVDFIEIMKFQQLQFQQKLKIEQLQGQQKLRLELLQKKRQLQQIIKKQQEGYQAKLLVKNWFSNKKISAYPNYLQISKEHMGEHPIIEIQIIAQRKINQEKLADQKNPLSDEQQLREGIHCIKLAISYSFLKHEYLLTKLPQKMMDSKIIWKLSLQKFERICTYSKVKISERDSIFHTSEISDALSTLCRLLIIYWGAKPVILVDQFDSIWFRYANKTCKEYLFSKLEFFYRMFIKSRIDERYRVVVVGIIPFIYSDLLSEINNFRYYDLFNNSIKPFIGFTSDEVREKLKNYVYNGDDLDQTFQEQFQALKDFCNGYVTSYIQIWNPWLVNSCLKQIKEFRLNMTKMIKNDESKGVFFNKIFQKFSPKWINSQNQDINFIKDIIERSKPNQLFAFLQFIEQGYVYFDHGQRFRYAINLENGTTIKDIFNYLFFTGFLTKHKNKENTYVLPNNAIRNFFISQTFQYYLQIRYPQSKDLEYGRELILNLDDKSIFKKNIQNLLNNRQSKINKQPESNQYESGIVPKGYLEHLYVKYLYIEEKNQTKLQKYDVSIQRKIGQKQIDLLIIPNSGDTIIIQEDKLLQAKSFTYEEKNYPSMLNDKIKEYQTQIVEQYLQIAINVCKSKQSLKKIILRSHILECLTFKAWTPQTQTFVKSHIHEICLTVDEAQKLKKKNSKNEKLQSQRVFEKESFKSV